MLHSNNDDNQDKTKKDTNVNDYFTDICDTISKKIKLSKKLEKIDNEYNIYYTEEISFIKIHCVYINNNNEIEKITEEKIFVYGDYTSFGTIAKALEDMQIEVQKSNLQRIPTSPLELTEDQMVEVEKMLDKIEDDDDIQQVFTNIA